MSIQDPRATEPRPPEPSRAARRAYERPRILHRESLEAMAADCSFTGGKGDPTCMVGFS